METSSPGARSAGRCMGSNPFYKKRMGSRTLPSSPANSPLRDPQRQSRKGQRALWMDSSHAPWPRRSKLTMFPCAISIRRGGGTVSSHPRVLQMPARAPPAPRLKSVFLFAPCHCVNTEVFFGEGTRLTVVGKTCAGSFGSWEGTAGPKCAFWSGPILMC